MNEQERIDWESKRARLQPHQADQWTEEVYKKYLHLRKTRDAWKRANGSPSNVLGGVKPEGMLTPLFIPNESYLQYQETQQDWVRNHEPEYIKIERARMSAGDFGEEDDWSAPATL